MLEGIPQAIFRMFEGAGLPNMPSNDDMNSMT
jgi:hypothetical protein